MGVTRFVLEVLQDNLPAIKAYQKTGFTVTRELDSFELIFDNARLNLSPNPALEIHEMTRGELHRYEACLDWQPSWENTLASIARIQNEVLLLGAMWEGKPAGILVYYPMLNWILCLAVHKAYRGRYIASKLLEHLVKAIRDEVKNVKIVNVQHSDQGMVQFLAKVGFEFRFSQYEMHKYLDE
jgi:ribosomal protein S18 acetylase RimI-like enzyme